MTATPWATYTFAMVGPVRSMDVTIGLTTHTITVPDITITQTISAVFKVPIIVDAEQHQTQLFDAVVYSDANGRNMTMIHAGNGVFVGYFSLAVEGPDTWSQGLLEYLLTQGMVVVAVPPAFVGAVA